MSNLSRKERVKVTIDVSEDERTYIKMLATKKKMTISEFIMSFVRPNIPGKEPNLETKNASLDVEKKRNLTSCKTVADFWKEVGIDPNA